MISQRSLTQMLGVVLIMPLLLQCAKARPAIWLAPLHPNPRVTGHGTPDYFGLFQPGAPWDIVRANTAVFQIYIDLLRRGSDNDIRSVIGFVKRQGLSLGVEMPVLTHAGWCQPGEVRTRWMLPLLERLKRLGGELSYVAMLGPLVDGHVYTKQFYCHLPTYEVALDAAATVHGVQRLFPAVKIGDVEPLASHDDYPTPNEFKDWFEAFKRAAGTPIAFIDLDIRWNLDWKTALKQVMTIARNSGVDVGVIYHGDPSASTSVDVSHFLTKHEHEVEQELNLHPQQVVFQSWLNVPDHVLPESDPTSLTGMVFHYLNLQKNR